MKKTLSVILTLALVICLAACGLNKTEEAAPKAFKAGVWAVVENGSETGKTYTFTDSMKECFYDNGLTGLGFDYEISGDSYIFHMGSVDDNSEVKAVFTDDENCTLTWADPAREETLKYVGPAEEKEESTEELFGGARPLIINSEPVVITAKDSFDNAGVTEFYCDATETYSFTASDDSTEWKVFVLDEKFEDSARLLPQAAQPALEGNGTLEIAEGKFIYILCSESAFSADAPSEASLSIYYAGALSGNYQDSTSQRASAQVTDNGDTVAVTVSWAGSAFERYVWEMNCTNEDGKLTYKDCRKTLCTSDDSGEETEEVIYENGEGYFTVTDGKLAWDGASEEECVECVFEK